MKKFIPHLNADIIPLKSAAGIDIGLSFDEFLKHAPHKLVDNEEYNKLSNTQGLWYVIHHKGTNSLGKEFDAYACRWNNDVVLQFDGKPTKILYGIIVSDNYKGSLFNELRINDRLDKLSSQYDLEFYADGHFLIDKEDADIYVPIEIGTDYLASYEDVPNQIIRLFYVIMHFEEQIKHGITWD